MALDYTKIQTYKIGGAVSIGKISMNYTDSNIESHTCGAYSETDDIIVASGSNLKYKMGASGSNLIKSFKHRGTTESNVQLSTTLPTVSSSNIFTIPITPIGDVDFHSNFKTLRAADINVSGYGDNTYTYEAVDYSFNSSEVTNGINVVGNDLSVLNEAFYSYADYDTLPYYKGKEYGSYSLHSALVPLQSEIEFEEYSAILPSSIYNSTILPAYAKITVYNGTSDTYIDFSLKTTNGSYLPTAFENTRYDDWGYSNVEALYADYTRIFDDGDGNETANYIPGGEELVLYIPFKYYMFSPSSFNFTGAILDINGGDVYSINKTSVRPVYCEENAYLKELINYWPSSDGFSVCPYSYNSFNNLSRVNGARWVYDLGTVFLGSNSYTKYIKFTPMYGNNETPASITVYTNSSLTNTFGSLDWQSSSDYLTKVSNSSAGETLYYRAVSHFGTTVTGTCIATTNTAYTTTIQLKLTTTVTYSATAYGGNNLTEFQQYSTGYESFSDTVQVATFQTPNANNIAFSVGNPKGDAYWNFDIVLTANTQTMASVQISVLLRKIGATTTIELGEYQYNFNYTTRDGYNTDIPIGTATLNGNTSYEIIVEVTGYMLRSDSYNYGYSELAIKMTNAGVNTIYLTYNN